MNSSVHNVFQHLINSASRIYNYIANVYLLAINNIHLFMFNLNVIINTYLYLNMHVNI